MPDQAGTSPETGSARSYAIRRVNPFLGVLQVIETGAGRTVSANGVAWHIEIRAERQTGWGSLDQNTRQIAWYRYGLWSPEDGLVTRPLAPHLDKEYFTQQSEELIDCISERLDQLPFRLQDRRELWLFDRDDRQPLALLAAALPGSALPAPEPRQWRSSISANGLPSQRCYPAAGELEALVRQRAGFNINRHWVTRQDDGSGSVESDSTRMDATAFPSFLLSEDWPDAAQAKLVGDYLEWIAPSLLTLQQLDRRQRERMENSLNIQAASIEHHWHLYPEIIDGHRLGAARVQCRLEKVNRDRSTRQ
jgi:hypothetical protein